MRDVSRPEIHKETHDAVARRAAAFQGQGIRI
jgi:hypothetical protein